MDAWARSHFQPGGGDALVMFDVYGVLPDELQVSRSRRRSEGIPPGVAVQRYCRDTHADIFSDAVQGHFGKVLKEQPQLQRVVVDAPDCLRLRGLVRDPKSLHFLRDVTGVIASLIESGAVAVLDWQTLRWWAAAEWKRTFFEMPFDAHAHVVILVSAEQNAEQTVWFHTRGMRKFGRPDLSLRNVNPAYQDAVIELFNRMIQLQALGQRVPDGQEIGLKGLPGGMRCRARGTYEDPDFNNVRIEIEWPH